MKRFHWPLQRLLDVTRRREQAREAELVGLSRRIARLRQEVLVRRAKVRMLVAEISAMEFAERVRRHEEVMAVTDAEEGRLRRLEARIAELAAERQRKAEQLVEVRRKRDVLERLRAEALREHLRQQERAEQKQFDESAHIGKARGLIRRRLEGAMPEAAK